MSVVLEEIKLKLYELRNLDKNLEVFGASSHRYKFNPVASAKEVDDFEAKYGCNLPDVYRAFLLEIGNGGAGPSYGVFPLEMMDNGFDLDKWPDYINPSELFVFTESFNDTSMLSRGEPEESDFSSVDEYHQAHDDWADENGEELQIEYWDKHSLDGAIPICHHGCANRSWIVVSKGSEYGNIWNDDTPDSGGVLPESTDGKERIKFEDWYLEWLDVSINQLKLASG